MNRDDDEAVTLRAMGRRIPDDLRDELITLHESLPESFHFGCAARAEGTWCCLDHVLGTDQSGPEPLRG